ncbi:MAG: Ig-like domain-containing protein [Thermoplasmatales archaeon]|nr:Ig-like domain-containing protein [Thermoplasmatales archaeon]
MLGKKLLPILLILGMIISGLGSVGQKGDSYIRGGIVYDSLDGFATIYTGEMQPIWNCTNITVYKNITELAVDDNNTDAGDGYDDYDIFKFDFGSQLPDLKDGDEVIAVGETNAGGKNYTFITTHIITERAVGCFNTTEWEPIPQPVVNSKGASWINISIPKFKNPQKELYDNLTTNDDNTICFAVYRGEENNSWTLDKEYLKTGNATYWDDDYYYFNDTNLSPRTAYYYAVAPVAKGGYITYGKSPGTEVSTVPLIVLNSPNGDEDWSGNTSHKINYTIQNGEPPYMIDLYYSVDDVNWSFIGNATHNQPGIYIYNWSIPTIDSSTVKVRVNVTDNKLVTDFDVSNKNFTIDSKPPTVLNAFPVNTGAPAEALVIQFNESVNTSSVENAFSITPNPGNLSWDWDEENKTATISHDDCILDVKYNCTINTTVKDDSDPGNYMISPYNWSFVVAIGYGNFTVEIDYPPSPVGVGDTRQIKVNIFNTLEGAVGKSGTLKLTFYRSDDNKTFNQIGSMKVVGGMMPDNSTTVNSDVFSFTYAGTWYLKVNITSTNPDDVINGYTQYYETPVYTVNVVPPEEIPEEEIEIGPEPYVLITVMVIAVVFIAVFVLLSLKKKGELVIKGKTKKEK